MSILKRLKLLFLDSFIVDVATELQKQYPHIKNQVKRKDWKSYDKIHKTLNIIETNPNAENKWKFEESINASLRLLLINKEKGSK